MRRAVGARLPGHRAPGTQRGRFLLRPYRPTYALPGGLDRDAQLALGAGVVAINVLVYGVVMRRRRTRSSQAR
jgi:hypothetical protein